MSTGPRPIGSFCWINVLTPASDDARAFFGSLLGWTFNEIPGMGHLIQVDGHDVGGFWDLHHANMPVDLVPGIGVMVRVESAAAMVERAIALGGRGEPAKEIGPSGTMGELHDPLGANIDIWQAGSSPGSTADPTRHGVPSWIEGYTTDVSRAGAFYRGLFGWTSEVMPMPGMEYLVFSNQGEPAAGMMVITPEMGAVPPHWATYVTVDDVDASAERAVALGGSVPLPPEEIPGIGRFAGLVSPQGVRFFVIRYSSL
ncbi:MAG: VOC family protein [Gemmatimonadales bacterium]|nr:VOC family protein [Gemmatimonadales bacterium]